MKKKEDIEKLEDTDELEEIEDEEELEEDDDDEEVEEKPKRGRKVFNALIFIVIICIALVMYAKYGGTKGLIVKEYRVESKILTSNFSGIKIVHISDILYKSTVDNSDIRDLVERVNILKPDIIVFTGNLVSKNAKMTTKDTDFLVSELSKMHANIGKYAIYGDYDYDFKSFENVITDSGFKILNNEFDEVFYKTNESMYIVGLPSSSKETVDLTKAFEFYNDLERKYTIVLLHEGKTIKYLDDSTYEVDLILGGHSLNGSIVLPFYGGVIKDKSNYKYSKPEYTKGITRIYMSSGMGTREYDYRFLNKPSFNLYRLKAQN